MMGHVVLHRAAFSADQCERLWRHRPQQSTVDVTVMTDLLCRKVFRMEKQLKLHFLKSVSIKKIFNDVSCTIAGNLWPLGWHNPITIFRRTIADIGLHSGFGLFENSAHSFTLTVSIQLSNYSLNYCLAVQPTTLQFLVHFHRSHWVIFSCSRQLFSMKKL